MCIRDRSYTGHYLFARDGVEISLDGKTGVIDAAHAKPGYTMNKPDFVYDSSDGLYHRYQYGDCLLYTSQDGIPVSGNSPAVPYRQMDGCN